MDRMDRKWTEMDSHFQEGYNAVEPNLFYRNGQEWTKMDSHFQEGYDAIEPQKNGQKWTRMDKNGQLYSGGIRTLLKKTESGNISCVNRSRHFETGTLIASQLRRMLRKNIFVQKICPQQRSFCKLKSS